MQRQRHKVTLAICLLSIIEEQAGWGSSARNTTSSAHLSLGPWEGRRVT